MFGSVDEKDLEIVIDAMTEKTGKQGDFIIKKNEDGDHLYVVESGTLTCTRLFPGETEERTLK